jgi:hypothetical protein
MVNSCMLVEEACYGSSGPQASRNGTMLLVTSRRWCVEARDVKPLVPGVAHNTMSTGTIALCFTMPTDVLWRLGN